MTDIVCTSACTVTLIVTPMTATADDYAAVSLIFAAALVALSLIWGAKYLIRMFSKPTDY